MAKSHRPRLLGLAILAMAATAAHAQPGASADSLAGEAPAVTPRLAIGAEVPLAEELYTTLTGERAALAGLMGERGTVVVFLRPRCPWVWIYADRLKRLVQRYQGEGVSVVVVAPALGNDRERQSVSVKGAPVLIDSERRLAHAFGARMSPEVFLFDAGGSLVYTGAIDDRPSSAQGVETAYLDLALERLLRGQPVGIQETHPFGCLGSFRFTADS